MVEGLPVGHVPVVVVAVPRYESHATK
jgi:hypothetical protein